MDYKFQQRYHEAQELYRQERWAEALVVLDDLALSYKSDKEIMLNRAMCLARIGKEEEAELLCDHLTVVHNDERAAQLKAQIPQARRDAKAAPKEIARREPWVGPDMMKKAIIVVFLLSAAIAGWTFFSTYTFPSPPPIATAPGPPARSLSFPDNVRLGNLMIRDWGYTSNTQGVFGAPWRNLGEAKGKVEVPAGQEVQLVLEPSQAQHLKSLKRLGKNDLQSLSIKNSAIGDGEMAYIAHLTGLFELDISNTGVGPQGFATLYRLTSLRKVACIGTTLGEPGRAFIASLTYIHQIDADRADLGDEWLKGLPPLEHLVFLSLDEIEGFTDEGIVHIARHKNLRKLFLSYTQMTDAGLAPLQKLNYLDRFWMEGTHVTDAGMAGFRTMPNIEEIGIAYTAVTSEGFMQLSGIRTLKKVGIRGCKDISLAAARSFKNQNPDCVVDTAMNL